MGEPLEGIGIYESLHRAPLQRCRCLLLDRSTWPGSPLWSRSRISSRGAGAMKDDRREDITRALLEILQALEDEGEHTREGNWSSGRTSVDYSLSIDGLADDAPLRSGDDGTHPTVALREYEDELLLVADIPGAEYEDVSVDMVDDGQMLRIIVDDVVQGRVPIGEGPWRIVDISFNNEILEVWFQDE